MDICLVYLSSTADSFSEKDLFDILRQSRQYNAKIGVTGVILYVRGRFVQVLEGEKAVVDALYKRIERDHRHTDVVKVLSRPISDRLFGNWAMGYETITAQQLDEIEAIIAPDKDTQEPPDNIILKTIKVFYDSNRYN